MKKSELRQLIKEEVRNVIKESNRKLSDGELWEIIEALGWGKDHDDDRTKEEVGELPKNTQIQLYNFYRKKMNELNSEFYGDWLDRYPISDDGWDDLRAEVIGRGEKFFNNITINKLKQMIRKKDYYENFGYSFR